MHSLVDYCHEWPHGTLVESRPLHVVLGDTALAHGHPIHVKLNGGVALTAAVAEQLMCELAAALARIQAGKQQARFEGSLVQVRAGLSADDK